MKLGRLLDFQTIGDERGNLVALESFKNVPFEIKRVYYLFENREGVERGFHAHKNLSQVAICLHGSCTFVLNDGRNSEEVTLNSKSQGLLIESMIWRVMKNFSPGAVLLVLASELYDEADYIRNFDEFISLSTRRQS